MSEVAIPDTVIQVSLPPNVSVGAGSIVTGDHLSAKNVFKRFRSRCGPALIIGQRSVMDGVVFNFGEGAFAQVGDDCYFHDTILICESEIKIGNRVVMCWHSSIMDADFHPLDPSERAKDAVAVSPLGSMALRPAFRTSPVVIEDDVWIGPNALILKGTRIGAGAIVEAGAVVTSDVAPQTRVLGNPAKVVST